MWDYMDSIAEGLVLEPGTEFTDPNFGSRSAMFSVRCDWRSYYDGPTFSGPILDLFGDLLIGSVHNVFYAFWDHDRIEEADMLPFFARLARGHEDSDYRCPSFNSQSEVEYDENSSWDSSWDSSENDNDDTDYESAFEYACAYDADDEMG